MGSKIKSGYLAAVVLHGFMALFMAGCIEQSKHTGKVIITRAPSANVDAASINSGNYRYVDGLRIVMGMQDEAPESMEVLTKEFVSARAPEVSYDGEIMVFSGKKTTGDSWQIWTIELDSKNLTQVTSSTENCTDPTWLPDGRIVFSKQVTDDSKARFHALFTIDPSGCCEQRVTYQPHDDLNAMVLNDGRILFSSQQVYPEKGLVKLMAMRPDGTKAELFYAPDSTVQVLAKACETQTGQVAFAASGLFSTVSFSRPLHTLEKKQISGVDMVQSTYCRKDGNLISSVRKSGSANFGLVMITSDGINDTAKEMQDAENHLIEPVMVEPRAIPKKLPSLMNMNDPAGYMVCLNADASAIPADISFGNSSKIQVLDYKGIVGETDIEQDGSFYLALPADQPLRFQTVNAEGNIVRGPSSWIWVRPSERRGCVGCHEDSEIAPENVAPKAVEKAPVAMIK